MKTIESLIWHPTSRRWNETHFVHPTRGNSFFFSHYHKQEPWSHKWTQLYRGGFPKRPKQGYPRVPRYWSGSVLAPLLELIMLMIWTHKDVTFCTTRTLPALTEPPTIVNKHNIRHRMTLKTASRWKTLSHWIFLATTVVLEIIGSEYSGTYTGTWQSSRTWEPLWTWTSCFTLHVSKEHQRV